MRGLKTTAIVIIIIGGLISIVPIIFYFVQFGDKNLATDSSVWGVFGDFVGGTINPVIGLVNLALLIAISIYVAKFDSHRQFNEYRYQAYVELCNKFDKTADTVDGLEELKEFMEIYFFNNQFLFPGQSNEIFNNTVKELTQTLVILIPIKVQFEEDVDAGKITTVPILRKLGRELETALKDWPKVETEESKALVAFSAAKKKILGFIQAVMIEGNIQKYK
jgi:hypothetical protein